MRRAQPHLVQQPATGWLRKGGSYFDRKLESDTWQLASVSGASRSALCAAATDAGFVCIEKLLEPRPRESMRTRFPDDYAKLNREPGFRILCLRRCGQPPSSVAFPG